MSGKPVTVEVAVDDLVELLALGQAATDIGVWFNGDVAPSPGWEIHDPTPWRLREKYLMADVHPDDDDAYEQHWAFRLTNSRADEIAAEILDGMLADEGECAGLARFFDEEPWTGRVTYPIPFHRLRRDMREHVNELRGRKEAEMGAAAQGGEEVA